MVADELRRQADEFVDLAHMIAKIGRDPVERPPRPVGEFGERERPRFQQGPGLERRYGIRPAPSAAPPPADETREP
jgi:hypothetical protein